MRLTDLSIRKLQAPEHGQKSYFDDSLPGFGVRISQGGSKSFVVMYGEKRRLKTLGRYPALSLADARKEARRFQVEFDKVPEAEFAHQQISFNDAKELFLDACRQKNKERTVYDYDRLLSRNFSFGKRLVGEIVRAEIQKSLHDLRDRPSEQHHAFVAVKVFLNWAVREEIITSNPLGNMRAPRRMVPRERYLADTELKSVYSQATVHPWPFGPIMKLLILTGQRRGEIAALQWSWIDEESQIITLPSELTKNGRTHVFPYGKSAAETFEAIPRMGEYVFPGRVKTARHFNGWGSCKAKFDTSIETTDPYTLHDLRRTFSSNMARLGTPIQVTEKILNHTSGTLGGVAGIYNRHTYIDEMRQAMETYDTYLANLITE